MDYGVQVGDLSERVKREVAVIGSPATLDEETWTAINATLVAAGHIEFDALIDNTDPAHPVIYTEADLPVELPLGSKVVARVKFFNDSSYPDNLWCLITFRQPDATARGCDVDTASLAAGANDIAVSLEVTLDKEGVWDIYSRLSDTAISC